MLILLRELLAVDRIQRHLGTAPITQDMTLGRLPDPDRPTADDDPRTAWIRTALRQTRDRAEQECRSHRIDRVWITIGGVEEFDELDDADTLRWGRRASMTLGFHWFMPAQRQDLPVVLEHELAHLRRYDNLRDLIADTLLWSAALAALAVLPLRAGLVVVAAATAAAVARRWWAELACDRASARYAGREASLAHWRRSRAAPRARGIRAVWKRTAGLRTHPPDSLRILGLRWVRTGSLGAGVRDTEAGDAESLVDQPVRARPGRPERS
ncbi:hypothetical protein BIV57_00460 [Mangrovactinospora gilvigrisea]|uniref:Peptidase M48 domain-containing protein n=1 Tax=Mangrovactinospora gilvigrisea TaxID=1428644 RepID=A0A1J7C0W0_9ACTN|nr:hypothetical protein BIV57_00460 [Mangrovactinospora gilvigrisea]